MLTYDELKTKPRDLLAATGLTQNEFETLLKAFTQAYQDRYPAQQTVTGQARQRRQGAGNKSKLRNIEDKLLFILVYEKTYPLQSMHGLQFGLSQGRVNEWVHRLNPILQAALSNRGFTPERDGQAVAESDLTVEGGSDLLIDGTERRRQRPKNAAAQKDHYSGKKSPYRPKHSPGQSA
jgi:hypothetical protein